MINLNDIFKGIEIGTALTIIATVLTLFYFGKELRANKKHKIRN